MKFFKMFFRGEQKTSVDVVEVWEVRWTSRHGAYFSSTSPEIRIFIKKEDAEEFAKALRDAFKLIRHTSGDGVYVSKQNIGA